ncbi:MAG: hypothetical protein AAGJ32_01640 [Pseudomonadota bacterium]
MTSSSSIVATSTLVDLGSGSQLALFGFRACAFGQAKCCCLLKTFKDVFGEESGGRVLGKFLDLARALGHDGRRKLKLAAPGCIRLTHDEASVLSALSAAQHGDESLRDAHLTWLLARTPDAEHQDLVDWISMAMGGHGLTVTPPEAVAEEPCETPKGPTLVSVNVGHA